MRSRDSIIASIMVLVEEGATTPSAEEVAARAGVGLRSVFRHFNDMESLFAEMTMRLTQRYQDSLAPFEATDWRGQVFEAMERRLKVFEALLPYRRAAQAHRGRSATIRTYHDQLLAMLRQRLERTVAPAPLAKDAMWVETLDMLLSTEVYERLRFEQALDHERASAVIRSLVEKHTA
ncbi:helix-turn-helix domain-containing protein [Sandarakinorhabdus sp.]|uniref:TetR/AcrR family transcriptional regulator n=1 Tax=Sandarakinorhabdus sp. TaxID=1916663 RepID=UPI00286E2221|nr:helix-turn-helix domain-containing protein [Sandarakinorhabdus sp.]